ncbi:MAG: hypothetical protein R3Y55_07130 [Rikenellaceae bacterium]
MKKIIFSMAVLTATFFASCSKESETINNSLINPVEGSVVTLSFVEDDNSTRAFFDENAAAEKWESELESVTIFAFDASESDSNGSLIVRRDFSDGEMEVKKSTFALPGTSEGDKVNVVVIANCTIPMDVVTATALQSMVNSNLADYNGAFSEVATASKRTDGFVMTSQNDVEVSADITIIKAILERTVAKVAVELALSEEFSDRYSGDMHIQSIEVSNTPSMTTLHSSFDYGYELAKDYTHQQATNVSSTDKFQNLFYIYESEVPTSDDEKVLLTIEAIYDMDGKFDTTGDQTPMTYIIALEDGSTIKNIDRNSYYRISGTIYGLSGSDAEISITVSDWSTVTNKDITLGN